MADDRIGFSLSFRLYRIQVYHPLGNDDDGKTVEYHIVARNFLEATEFANQWEGDKGEICGIWEEDTMILVPMIETEIEYEH